VWPGNTLEVTTVSAAVRDLTERFAIRRVIAVVLHGWAFRGPDT
jgi:hypothetical protein